MSEGRSSLSQKWSWREYGAGTQNWDVAQAPSGLVYVANQNGLLEFDGADWRFRPTPFSEYPTIMSVDVDGSGNVYASGVGDFGRLVSDSLGTLRYVSLKEHIAPSERSFADVWKTHAASQGVVFQTAERLFLWDGRRMQSWGTSTRFRTSFEVDGRVIVTEDGVGLREIRDGDLQTIRHGAAFADKKVDALLPHREGLLAIVRDEGLVRIGERGVEPIEGTGSAYLRAYRPYTAVAVPDLYGGGPPLYAVATIQGGVAIIDASGRLVRVYREDVGMTEEDFVVGLEPDGQGGLWAALTNGIVRIDLFSRYTWFDETVGLLGSVQATQRWEGDLYAATAAGVYRLRPGRLGRSEGEGPAYAAFVPVPGFDAMEQMWDLDATPAGLLVASNSGVQVVRGGRLRRVSQSEPAFSFLGPSARPDWRFVGRKDGVGLLVLRDGVWTDQGRVDGIEGDSRSMVEDADGRVWVSQTNGSVYVISGVASGHLRVREFAPGAGFDHAAGPLVRVGDEVWMTPREGVVRLSLDRQSRLVTTPVPRLDGVAGVYALYTVGGEVWIFQDGVLHPLGGEAGRGAFEIRDVQVSDVRRDASGVTWVATADGLLRYDPRVGVGETSYPAFVRRVTDRQRETLYGGARRDGSLVVPYGGNSELRFEAAAAFFERPDATEYQFRLDGWDSDWSAWGPERVTGFTNLWEGDYTLRVRARDIHGKISEEAAFSFRVLPPWYRTWWAYALYVLALVAVVWGISTWRLRENRRKLAMQRVQSARLQRLSTRLEKTNARLRQADRLKDDLLANTSHELRTPLTAILGFSEMLLDEADGESRFLAEGIQRGGQRLLGTVNGLLDMFKLQSGTMPVEVRDVEVVGAVRESVALLQPLAAAKGLDLHVVAEREALPSHIDPDLLDRVVTNLVANAIKFTASGRVAVSVGGSGEDLRVVVRDTGIGIAEADVARIFEPFEQASSGFGRTHEGTGLGLAIVSRVLDLVGGRATVESEVGRGTAITVVVPRAWAGAAAPSADVEAPARPALDGAHVLGMGLDDATLATLRSWIEPHGEVRGVGTIGRAVREARRTAYDVVLLAASDAGRERKWMALLRSIPGYEGAPVLRVGGAPLSDAELAERGFFGQTATPLDTGVMIDLLEGLLARVEAAVLA